jgi:hypothetical protein
LCVAASKDEARAETFFYRFETVDSVTEKKVSTTIILLLAAWLGLNVVFVVMRFYVTAGRGSRAKPDIIGYPRLVN